MSLDTPPRLVLASGSPRRRLMLSELGVEAAVRPVDLDETPLEGEGPEALVLRLATAKATAISRPGELVLAADTVVVLDEEILGKPADASEAAEMLHSLAGREHDVFTGTALFDVDAGRQAVQTTRTRVRIAALSAQQIEWYVATGEPLDKAGAYGIQGLGALFVEAVDGSYTNVVGLPLPTVYRLFSELGHDLLARRVAT